MAITINTLLTLLALLAAACHSTGARGLDVSTAAFENGFSQGAGSGGLPCGDCTNMSHALRTVKLEDTDWKFLQFGDQTTGGRLVSADIYLRLRSQGRGMRLFDGCNVIFGQYELRGEKLRFRINGVTDWACSEATDKQRRFLETLQGSATWNILGETLQLYNAGNKTLARFEVQAAR